MTPLTATQEKILQAAATRPERTIFPMPHGIQGGAALKVIKALSGKGLIHDVSGNNDWRISDDGLRAIGIDPDQEKQEKQEKANPLLQLFEKIAMDHLFIDTLETRKSDSLDFHEVSVWGVLSALTAAYEAGVNSTKRKPNLTRPKSGERKESKQSLMIAMLRRPEGATAQQIAEEVGWSLNTVRGAISGALKKKLGMTIIAERTRMVGPNKNGAPGSYTLYKLCGSPHNL